MLSDADTSADKTTDSPPLSESRHKTYPKSTYKRSRKFLQEVASLECQNCGAYPSQAAHSNWHGKGMALKASDEMVAALCLRCHWEVDQGNKLTKEERKALWENAYKRTMERLGFAVAHLGD